MPSCTAYGCTNRDERGQRREKGLTFHRFPNCDKERLRRWVVNIRRVNWTPTARSHLCSAHFTEDCFDRTGQTVRLRPSATPTIFAFPEHLQKSAPTARKPPMTRQPTEEKGKIPPPSCSHPDSPVQPNTKHSGSHQEHTYATIESPRKLKRKLDATVEQLQKCRKKLKIEQQKSRRLKHHQASLPHAWKQRNVLNDY
uniref:THAP domain-containing protein 1-like n=1 Tax=Myxine glutinosa TaxID=7769 RepID=UPI0035900B30